MAFSDETLREADELIARAREIEAERDLMRLERRIADRVRIGSDVDQCWRVAVESCLRWTFRYVAATRPSPAALRRMA
jgi:hypothetical protein